MRHYAHAECGLRQWGAGFFDRLHAWQLDAFPVFAAHQAGLLPELEAAARAAREKQMAAVRVKNVAAVVAKES